MKKSMLILALVFGISSTLFAQEHVPERVKSSFQKEYANAKGVEWKEKNGMYQARFEENNTAHWVDYNADGTVKMKGHEIAVSELPGAVSSAIRKSHPKHTIEKASVVEENGKTLYKAKLEGEREEMHRLYNADGTVAREMEHHKKIHKANKSGIHKEKKEMHKEKKKSGM